MNVVINIKRYHCGLCNQQPLFIFLVLIMWNGGGGRNAFPFHRVSQSV
jgi:hypothetical protein